MLDHLADLESDFSRFHRIDDMYALDGPKFLRLAWRIAAYDGMLTRRIEAQNHKPDVSVTRQRSPGRAATQAPARRGGSEGAAVPSRASAGATVVPASAMALMHPGLIEITRAEAAPTTPSP